MDKILPTGFYRTHHHQFYKDTLHLKYIKTHKPHQGISKYSCHIFEVLCNTFPNINFVQIIVINISFPYIITISSYAESLSKKLLFGTNVFFFFFVNNILNKNSSAPTAKGKLFHYTQFTF